MQVINTGYTIEKFEVNNENNTRQLLKSVQVLPWKKHDFAPYIDGENKQLLAAGHTMHGDWETNLSKNKNIFSRKEEANNRYSIAMYVADIDSTAAKSLGLLYIDEEVVANKEYFYIVSARIDTLSGLIRNGISIQSTPIQLPQVTFENVMEGEGKVSLYWDKEKYIDNYTAYWIEKSTDGIIFKRITNDPILPTSSLEFESNIVNYTDSVTNYQKADYRIIGITPFGYSSAPSHGISAMGRDKTPPRPPSNMSFIEKNNGIELNWKAIIDTDLTHFNVYRGLAFEGHFEKVNLHPISKDIRIYEEKSEYLKYNPYYMVSSVDSAGNESKSLKLKVFLRDTLPPAPPKGLKGKIDTNGVVTLTWKANTEEDIAGYMVYFSNQRDYFYTNLTGQHIKDSTYFDTITLKTLNEYIFYRVSAVDHFRHISDFSDILELKKPDIIAPQPPHIFNIKTENDHLIIQWKASKSMDVAQQCILRRKSGETSWDTITRNFSPDYKDLGLVTNSIYEYTTLAIDDDGLVSIIPKLVKVFLPKQVKTNPPEIAPIVYDTLQNALEISWIANAEDSNTYSLYRSVDEGPFLLIASLPKEKQSYNDKLYTLSEARYTYKIKTNLVNGVKTKFSNEMVFHLIDVKK